jgi:hypothetical protein
METGVNQKGFISSYSPIGEDEQGHYWAAPEYYGMLAFAQCGMGRIIGSTVDAGRENISVHATRPREDHTVLTLINKELAREVLVVIDGAPESSRSASLIRLSGPSFESKSEITLGGAAVSSAGLWKAVRVEDLTRSRGNLKIRVPAASAALITLHA